MYLNKRIYYLILTDISKQIYAVKTFLLFLANYHNFQLNLLNRNPNWFNGEKIDFALSLIKTDNY